jgi:hypothetical protein
VSAAAEGSALAHERPGNGDTAVYENARLLLEHGASLLLLHGVDDDLRCTCGGARRCRPGKHPIPQRWWQTRDLGRIEEWLERHPCANLGAFWPRCVAIDVDLRKGGDDTLAELERRHGELPESLRVITGGGGEHRIFRLPEGVAASELAQGSDLLGRGVDIVVGDRGYLVCRCQSLSNVA